MAFQMPVGSAITGTTRVAGGLTGSAYSAPAGYDASGTNITGGYGAGVTSGTTMMGPAIQTVWSKEILFQAMPVLRFEQFAVKKTELGVMPGLTVNFMRYNNLPIPTGPLVEGIRMKTYGITAQQYRITVAEHGFAVAVSELLLNASFDDVMASASRLLGRNMALYMDIQARESIQAASSVVYGYAPPSDLTTGYGVYNRGTQATSGTIGNGGFYLTPAAIKDAVLELSSKNIPRLGETYVCFIHPSQSRQLRDTPEFIEVSKYAAPGNFMLGEIGRLFDVVFIETTQIGRPLAAPANFLSETYSDATPVAWRGDDAAVAGAGGASALTSPAVGPGTLTGSDPNKVSPANPTAVSTPGWDQHWPADYTVASDTEQFEALMLGDNAFGHAISLPVELRDGGVLDFGREHALAWYSIWGFGLITDSAVVKIRTNG
jgi:N4-gp56 family major capsid protein